jgi:hypothetical protein
MVASGYSTGSPQPTAAAIRVSTSSTRRALGHRLAAARHAHGGPQHRLAAPGAAEPVAEQVPQHALGHRDVHDGAAGDRPDHPDVLRGAARHAFGGLPDGHQGTGVDVDGGHAGFVDDQPGVLEVDAGAGGTEVDGGGAAAELFEAGCRGHERSVPSWPIVRRYVIHSAHGPS